MLLRAQICGWNSDLHEWVSLIILFSSNFFFSFSIKKLFFFFSFFFFLFFLNILKFILQLAVATGRSLIRKVRDRPSSVLPSPFQSRPWADEKLLLSMPTIEAVSTTRTAATDPTVMVPLVIAAEVAAVAPRTSPTTDSMTAVKPLAPVLAAAGALRTIDAMIGAIAWIDPIPLIGGVLDLGKPAIMLFPEGLVGSGRTSTVTTGVTGGCRSRSPMRNWRGWALRSTGDWRGRRWGNP